jgi:hypothetical protein
MELVEPRAVARERSRARAGPVPGVLRIDLEVHDEVAPKRLPHPVRLERARPERDDLRVGPVQELEREPLLPQAQRVLALALVEGLERLAERALELPV